MRISPVSRLQNTRFAGSLEDVKFVEHAYTRIAGGTQGFDRLTAGFQSRVPDTVTLSGSLDRETAYPENLTVSHPSGSMVTVAPEDVPTTLPGHLDRLRKELLAAGKLLGRTLSENLNVQIRPVSLNWPGNTGRALMMSHKSRQGPRFVLHYPAGTQIMTIGRDIRQAEGLLKSLPLSDVEIRRDFEEAVMIQVDRLKTQRWKTGAEILRLAPMTANISNPYNGEKFRLVGTSTQVASIIPFVEAFDGQLENLPSTVRAIQVPDRKKRGYIEFSNASGTSCKTIPLKFVAIETPEGLVKRAVTIARQVPPPLKA